MRPLTRRSFNLLAAATPFSIPYSSEAVAVLNTLGKFHAALARLTRGGQTVTVLHLGDSHIAGDYLTAAMRNHLQTRYGNAGRGLVQVPAYQWFRINGATVSLQGKWTNLNSRTDATTPYGLTGVAVRSTDAGDTLEADSTGAQLVKFHILRQPGGGKVSVSIAGKQRTYDTNGEIGLIANFGAGSSISLRAEGSEPVTVLGIEFRTNRRGVRYVNLGIPGATAQVIERWDDTIITSQLAILDPSLVILSFGVNEAFTDNLDLEAWRKSVEQNVIKLKNLTPQASWVIMGPSDAQRDHGPGAECSSQWIMPTNLNAVHDAMESIATKIGALFWDWRQEMGGACSMPQWIAEGNGRADHVHFTEAGYTKLASMLLKAIVPKS